MNRSVARWFAVALALAAWTPAARAAFSPPPPVTRVATVWDTLHGVPIPDPYRWLENQDAPDTRAWIAAQQQYEQAVMKAVPGRAALRARYAALLQTEASSVPFERGGRYFFTRRAPSQDLSVLYVRDGLAGADRAIADPNGWSTDHTISANWSSATDDGRLAAYAVRKGGADETEIRVLDLERNVPVDTLPRRRYFGTTFVDHGRAIVYAQHTPQGPRVFRHAIGRHEPDARVFGEAYGPSDIIDAGTSAGGRWLVFTVYHGASGDNNEIWLQSLVTGGAPWPLVTGIHAGFYADAVGDTLVLRTNWQAPNGRFLLVDLQHPGQDRWKEIVPASGDVVQDFTLAGHRLLVHYLHSVASLLRLYDLDGHTVSYPPLPVTGRVDALSGRGDGREVFYGYQSCLVPRLVQRLDVSDGRQQVWWRPHLPFSGMNDVVEQVVYASKDGMRVPMFLAHRKDVKPDGARPTLLTGYGGFDIDEALLFRPEFAIWVENGGVIAEPALRGGDEFGEAWHQAGMLGRKQNVFDDFEWAAQWLIDQRWTNPTKLAIQGTSNGGLLVGAALTQRPELFQAVVCGFPLLDMLRYQNFLVARFWVPEYGSSEDVEQFKWLYAYSPYQHVQYHGRYPAVLLVSGDSDTRVAPLHARKMTALLQAQNTSDRPILLHYDTTSGHSAGASITKQIEDGTDILQFLLWQLGALPATTAAR
ncbi:MAG TPA: prolyl oligopeptidase family serine peptidase [Candidatus Eisenbacteria bacterium]|nr:prolyl oligopeptidase family serine peptidase [Candidatus Eisenbacteria bacterium]